MPNKRIQLFSRYCLTLLLLVMVASLQANNPKDKSLKKIRRDSIKATKNLRLSILGGPGYTPDFGLLIGGSTLATFRTDARDTTLKRSVVPVGFAIMFNGGFNLISRPQLYFNKDRVRVFGQIIYKNTLDNYYGVGYETNKNTIRSKETTQFTNNAIQFNPILLFRTGNSDFFTGPLLDITYDVMSEPSLGVVEDPHYQAQGGDADGLTLFNTGVGVDVSYDTRDLPANAYNGLLFDFKYTYYTKWLGGDANYSLITLEYRQFKKLPFMGKRKVLAWMAQSKNSFGDVPLTRMPFVGSPFDLRGFYIGQYRDLSSHLALLEYRNMFNTDKTNFWGRLYNKLGFATWAGLGLTGPNIGEINGVLPNLGAGLRIEVQPRMNFRIDLGHNPVNKEVLVYFNMTEAF